MTVAFVRGHTHTPPPKTHWEGHVTKEAETECEAPGQGMPKTAGSHLKLKKLQRERGPADTLISGI